MKKRYLLLLLSVGTACALFGCGTNTSEEAASEEADAEITGYLVDDADQYVTLGTYTGLDVEHPVYTVSDDEVAVEVDYTLYEYSDVQTVDREAQDGDLVTADITATVEGDSDPTLDEEDYTVELGYEEFGADFDQQLIGCKAGDTLEFSCSFTDDTWYEEWTDQTVNFEVTVNAVEELITPEYTDEFVTDTLGYDSKEDFEAALREELETGYEEQSAEETKENAMMAAMDGCEFTGYPDDLYETCEADVTETYTSFADIYGMSVDELYEAYDMSEEDVEAEIMDTVNRRIFISAICQAEGLSITSSQYAEYLDSQYEDYGYEDAETFEEDYGTEYLVWALYDDTVSTYLVNNSTLYDAPVSMDEEDLEVYDEEETETEGDVLEGLDMSGDASEDTEEAETESETEAETTIDTELESDLEIEVETEAETA